MENKVLGKTGLKVSALGFGGIPIQRVDQEAAIAVIRTCLEQGITFIDTARGYTDSEEKIGAALAGLPRDSYVLATKTMARTGPDMARDIQASLTNLQTDYIDLYQCHNVRFDGDEEKLFAPGGGMEALLKAKAAGQIGHIGITGHQVDRMVRLLQTGLFETVQVPYNFNEEAPEQELLPLVQKENIGFITMKPLGGGALPPDLALRFFLDKPVDVVIPGMDSVEQVAENLRSFASGPLTEKDQAEIARVKKELGSKYCRRCDYCQPCPQSIDISNVFLFHGYYTRYGMREWPISRYNALPIKASICIKCGVCASRCPYDLPIPAMLEQAVADMEGK